MIFAIRVYLTMAFIALCSLPFSEYDMPKWIGLSVKINRIVILVITFIAVIASIWTCSGRAV